jgi:hypothetical protein
MGYIVDSVADRILAVDWAGPLTRTRSRAALMREYLRRSAWWAQAVPGAEWPFYDIAATVDPSVRADPAVVARVRIHLDRSLQGVMVQRTAEWALHFAALLESGRPLPAVQPSAANPFEPLILMFERGGGFRLGSGYAIEVDTAALRPGALAENLFDRPLIDPARLDDLDVS